MTGETHFRVTQGDKSAESEPGETVLQTLLRAGVDTPYSCRNGMCLTCITRLVRGKVPSDAQIGIKDTLREQGYFLPCVCTPTGDIETAPPEDAALFGRALITEVEALSATVCRVRFVSATPLYYRAGQFVNVRREDGLTRAYSLASVPSLDKHLELHVKRLPRGMMSNWIYDDLRPGESVDIQGPNGSCFYIPADRKQPMVLIGNGTGLAPLIGIVRDALNDGHTGPIHLYHGTRKADGLYLDGSLRDLETARENFHYTACTSREDIPKTRFGRAENTALDDHPDLSGWRVYLSGYPPMVHDMQRRAFLAGASLSDIYIDPFELRDLRTKPRE